LLGVRLNRPVDRSEVNATGSNAKGG